MRSRLVPVVIVVLALAALSGPARAQGVWVDLGGGLPGTNGSPLLAGTGTLAGGNPVSLSLTSAKPISQSLLLISTSSMPASFHGGTLVAVPQLLAVLIPVGGTGSVSLSGQWPFGVFPGTSFYFQYIIQDAGAVQGFALSNAVKAEFLTKVDQAPGH